MAESREYNLWLYLAYDGSGYEGWQKQPHGRTVQNVLENALRELTGIELRTYGCGRTDRGVHADIYAVTVWLRGEAQRLTALGLPYWLHNLRRLLPDDIRLFEVQYLDGSHHARHTASRRQYTLQAVYGESVPVRERHHITQLRGAANWGHMVRTLRGFIGHHDFTGISVNDAGSSHVYGIEVRDYSGLREGATSGRIDFRITADRFLRRQVRSMVGAAWEAGRGRLERERFLRIWRSGLREPQLVSVGPQGLSLTGLCYDFGWVRPPAHCTHQKETTPWLNVATL